MVLGKQAQTLYSLPRESLSLHLSPGPTFKNRQEWQQGPPTSRALSMVSPMFCVVWSIARMAYSPLTCGVSALLLDNPSFITAGELFTCLSFPFNLLKQAMFWVVLTSKLPEAWRVWVSAFSAPHLLSSSLLIKEDGERSRLFQMAARWSQLHLLNSPLLSTDLRGYHISRLCILSHCLSTCQHHWESRAGSSCSSLGKGAQLLSTSPSPPPQF